jgi:hypothetical protein
MQALATLARDASPPKMLFTTKTRGSTSYNHADSEMSGFLLRIDVNDRPTEKIFWHESLTIHAQTDTETLDYRQELS